MKKSNVLFLNHTQQQCGVYQYGKRSYDILKKADKFNFIYAEIESEVEYWMVVNSYHPIAIIYNYHPLTMPWLNYHNLAEYFNVAHFCLHHEGDKPTSIQFDYYLMVDSTFIDTHDSFAIPRPLVDSDHIHYPEIKVPTVSSFGLGFKNKGFSKIVKLVNDQFDQAIIRLQITRSFFCDRNGQASSQIFSECYSQMKNPNIKLEITTDFLDNQGILNFLATSTINVFLYDIMPERGLSSVMDYAININKPIAISKSHMFRHVKNPSIFIEDKSLTEIINYGSDHLLPYRDKWSHANFIKRYETLIDNLRK